MMNDDERVLIERAKHGESTARQELYRRYSPWVYSLAVRTLRNQQQAEDALQETFIEAFGALAGFRGGSRLKTWLYTIQYRVVGKMLSARGRELPAGETLANHPHKPSERAMATVETRAWVEDVLAQLLERDRMVLLLAYWEDLTLKEIAEVHGISENNAKVLLFRARKRFKAVAQPAGKEWENEL